VKPLKSKYATEQDQQQFRLIVWNYSRVAGITVDEAAALIRPGLMKIIRKRSRKRK